MKFSFLLFRYMFFCPKIPFLELYRSLVFLYIVTFINKNPYPLTLYNHKNFVHHKPSLLHSLEYSIKYSIEYSSHSMAETYWLYIQKKEFFCIAFLRLLYWTETRMEIYGRNPSYGSTSCGRLHIQLILPPARGTIGSTKR